MVDSPVESSPVHFCVSIRLTVQSSPVESSFVLDTASSPVESSFVLDTVGSPVESPVQSSPVLCQDIVKSIPVQWNPDL